jgi:hypothetical protein
MNAVRPILSCIWLGHSSKGISEHYKRKAISQNVEYRKSEANRVGLGFDIPTSISAIDTKFSISGPIDTKSNEKMAA